MVGAGEADRRLTPAVGWRRSMEDLGAGLLLLLALYRQSWSVKVFDIMLKHSITNL